MEAPWLPEAGPLVPPQERQVRGSAAGAASAWETRPADAEGGAHLFEDHQIALVKAQKKMFTG